MSPLRFRFPRVLSMYVVREVLLYMAVGLVGVSLAFLGQNLLRYLSDMLGIGVSGTDVFSVLQAVIVVILAYTIPIGFLFGVLAGVGRMANDSEITAFRANGVGIAAVLAPVLLLAVLVSAVTAYLAIDVEHRTKRQLRDLLVSMTTSGRMIQPQRFTQIDNRMIYVDSRDRDNQLEGVFISDQAVRKKPMLVFAEQGTFSFDADRSTVRFQLRNGAIHIEPKREPKRETKRKQKSKSKRGVEDRAAPASGDEVGAMPKPSKGYQKISFEAFDYSFDTEAGFAARLGRVRPKDMTMDELREIIALGGSGESNAMLDRYGLREFEVQLHRRFALPLAPIVFALLAVPLSLRQVRGVRSRGVMVCGALCIAYYCVVTFFQYLAVEAVLPVLVGLWLPNLGFAAVGVFLVARARQSTV